MENSKDPQISDLNQESNADLEVFRVPPKEMLEKYAVSNPHLRLADTTSQKRQEPIKKEILLPGPKQPKDFEAKQPPVSQTAPAKNVLPQPQPVNAPFVSETNVEKPKDILAETEPVAPEVQVQEAPANKMDQIVKQNQGAIAPPATVIKKKSKVGLIFLIFFLILVLLSPVVLLALEWLGVFSFGLSKYFGAPPARLIWSKIDFPVDIFSTNFSGEIVLPNQGEIKKFLQENNFGNLKEVKFSGTASRNGEKIIGTFSWENETAIPFVLDQGALYLQKEESKWYKLSVGTFSLKNFFDSFSSFLRDPTFFQRTSEKESGYYWYTASKFDVFDLSYYLSVSSFNMNLALNPKTKMLDKYWAEAQFADGTKINLRLNDISQDLLLEETLGLESNEAADGKNQFDKLAAFLTKLTESEFVFLETSDTLEETKTVSEKEINERDKQRKNDLKIIAEALEKYYEAKAKYPEYTPRVKIEEAENTLGADLNDYLPQGKEWDFVDPKYPDFWYFYVSDGENYVISARLENTKDSEAVISGGKYIYYIVSSPTYNPLR